MVSEFRNQNLIGQKRESDVVLKSTTVSEEERCVASLRTAAKETGGEQHAVNHLQVSKSMCAKSISR